MFKGQLQRFHKLISNDRIWPSEHGFKVIFEKSLFVFEISAFKVTNKRGIHSRLYSFSENNNPETFVCDVTSDQSSMISTKRSDLVTAKQVKTAKFDGFWKKLWFTVLLMTANDSRKTNQRHFILQISSRQPKKDVSFND